MRIIDVTEVKTETVFWVNTKHILTFHKIEGATRLIFTDGWRLDVQETPSILCAKLRG